MNNDLISRSAVIAIIEKKRLWVGKRDLSAEYKLAEVQEEIENLPIAYDVNKVVEQLEKHKKEINNRKERDILNVVGKTNAKTTVEKDIEIVKSGGIM